MRSQILIARCQITLTSVFVATIAACTQHDTDTGSGPPVTTANSPQAVATPTFATNPGTGLPYVVEPNFGGQAASLKVLMVAYGRLVDVYDRNPVTGARTLRFVDLLIGANIDSNGVNFLLEQKPLTQKSELTVLHSFGTQDFASAFTALEAGLQPFLIKSFDPSELPPFTAMPRNAALAIRLDDLLLDGGDPGDPGYPGTINASTVKLIVGNPPAIPFEARILPDPNHGDLVNSQFHSTRVIVDMSVSELEAQSSNLPVNPFGLPAALGTSQANAGIRVPTLVNTAAGQFQIVRNLAGAGLSFTGNGATDPTSPTLDVVRAFRSGGQTSTTGDPHNGFLADSVRPNLLVELPSFLSGVSSTATPGVFRITVRFPDLDCVPRMRVGDILQTATNTAELIQVGPTGAKARLIAGSPGTFGVGVAQFTTTWSPTIHLRPECVARFLPTPGDPPVKQVSNQASAVLSFTEPIDPASVSAFDTFTVRYAQSSNPIEAHVVGQIVPSVALTQFTFDPALPLKHVNGTSERYLLDIDGTAVGITDLAGNPLEFDPPETGFFLKPMQASLDSGGLSFRFASPDENGDGAPELRGQFVYDLTAQALRPRAVQRFSAVVDSAEPTINLLAQTFGTGQTQVPLVRYGSRVQALWRYHDMGFTLMEVEDPNVMPPNFLFRDAYYNLDVEGLNWAPSSGTAPLLDNYPRFQIGLSHSKFLPDETNALFIDSGLTANFSDNLLDLATDPLTVVHAAALGYVIQPLDSFVAATTAATRMAPWPLNRGIAPSQYQYWTWRDTAKTAVGGPNNQGVDYGLATLVGDPNSVLGVYPTNLVPTIGLPLLMDFRAYPSTTSGALNALAGVFAAPTTGATIETRPFFFAQSSGGVTSTGTIINVEPDAASNATDTPPGGSGNLARSQFIYYGQADFVTRVNRVHTIWFDTGGVSSFVGPKQEPNPTNLPPGTQVTFAFRGATLLGGSAARINDARNYGPYGDPSPLIAGNFAPTFVNGDTSWKSDITQVVGARWIQMRMSLVSNAQNGEMPVLSALGIAFYR